MTFQAVFRLSVLVLLSATIFIAWGMKDNGRYVYHPETAVDTAWMVDSRSGTVFLFDDRGLKGFVELHPQTGEGAAHYFWQKKAAQPKPAVPEETPER